MQKHEDLLVIGGKEFQSRLIVGTGKYPTLELMQQCHEASGADMVTVAVRRMELPGTSKTLLDYVDRDRFTILPNTAGCYDADSAILTARLAREAGLSDFVKLEVIGDQKTLFPDVEELLKATRILAKEGFIVMPYTNDDPITAKKLEDAGAAVVMPLGAPIGSGLGICNPYNIRLIMETVKVPVIVDAGVGLPEQKIRWPWPMPCVSLSRPVVWPTRQVAFHASSTLRRAVRLRGLSAPKRL